MERKIEGITLELVQGDIAAQEDMEAVVNAANAELKIGGGVAGAIHRGAGPELETACRPLAPIEPGEAVITKGFKLPNDYVIHTLGPVYGRDKPVSELLADCYRNSLLLAEGESIESIAFPAISTGAFGYPKQEAAEIAFRSIGEIAGELNNVSKVRFVLYGEHDYQVHSNVLERILQDS